MKGRTIKYSVAELAWVKANSCRPRPEAHAEFCAKFARTDVSLTNFNALCKRNGWLTGRTGRFVLGQEAFNKGKRMPFNANSAKTQFKKGGLPHNHRGAGHERICNKDGYVILIVDEVNPWTGAATRPVHKHRYLWEKANGPIPEGHVLKCLDGDKTNCDPSNWRPVPQATLPRLSGGRWYKPYEKYDPELRPTILAVAQLEHAAREAAKRDHDGDAS